jgi:PKD repeat protein
MMKKILLLILITTAFVYQSSAQCLMYPVLLSQRAPQSNLIIEGKVINKQSFWNVAHNKIYTSNLVEVYKTFKNTSSAYLEVITEGGIVGTDKHVFEPTLELELGDVGIFTLNPNTEAAQFGKPVFEAYASTQGFIKYDIINDKATEPFNTYLNASTNLYPLLAQLTNANYVQIKPINPFQPTSSVNTIASVATITSFSPTTITAGTFSVLTINGSGFGATSTPSLITFKNADDGGATTISPIASQIVSWSATQIQVKVPSAAGTGIIGVNGVNSTSTLTIPYSHLNLTNSGNVYNTKHYANSGGGYVWTYNSAFITNAAAKAAFERSLQSWRCATYINWTLAATTSSITSSVNDGVNIVTFNGSLGAGILGQCGSYWSGCGTNPNMTWFVVELDIQFANSPGGLTWQYGPTAPSGSQYDFESVTVHELGHGHQLGHVINSSDLMHYALSNGQSKRTLNTDDLNGGLAVMVRNAQAGGVCGNVLMTPLTSSNCSIGAPTASFTANKTTVCPGQSVAYADASTGNPTSWQWVFAGGTPSTSAVQNPTVTYNTAGTYSTVLTASNSIGNSVFTQTAYITVSSPVTLPLTQDFQTATFPPTNWSLVDGASDGDKWILSTSAGQASTQSALFDNWSTDVTGTRDEIKTFVNLSGFTSASMTFYRAYGLTYSSPNIDSLEVRISTDCGTTTIQKYLRGGSQLGTGAGTGSSPFVPTATQWNQDTVDLTPYVGQTNVMVTFINRSHYGDAMYLDNINITGLSSVAPTATISATPNSVCVGQSVALTNSSSGSPTSYSWNTGGGSPATASTSSITVSYTTSGVKTISLTVANGTGTTTSTATISVIASPTTVLTSTNPSCFGACNGAITASSTGGSAPYTYTVTPGACSTLPCTSLCAGTYSVITSNSGGCTSTSIINLTQPTALVVSPTTTNVTCNGACNGAFNATVSGGTPGYVYSTPLPSSGLCPGNYTFSVTDSKGCSVTNSVTITQPLVLVVTPTATNVTCNSACNGVINANVSGGTSPYTYSPSLPLSGLCAGNYTFSVTDSKGCSTTNSVTITQPTALVVTPTSTNVTCFGACNGAFNTSVSGGTPGYVYSTPLPSSALCAGNYTFSVTDSKGCSKTSTVTITQPTAIIVTPTTTNVTCFGGCDGSYNASVSGGTPGYTYSTPLPSSGLCAGNYTFSVTDSKGCSTTTSITITQPTVLTINATASPSLICSGGTSNLTATGATSYTWSPVTSLSSGSGSVVVASPTTTTTYTISGSNGTCSGNTVVTLNVSSCTGVNKLLNTYDIIVSPNPSTGLFTITLNNITDAVDAFVTNALGQIVKTETTKNTSQLNIDLSGMSKGIYYLTITTHNGKNMMKLILD